MNFSKKLKIFQIWGIPISIDSSWFVIFYIYVWTMAIVYLPKTIPNMARPSYWLLGIITSLLFFVSILIHELGHSWAALKEQIQIQGITLHIWGGLAYLEHEPKTALAELKIAAAGPIASFLLAIFFYFLKDIFSSLHFLSLLPTLSHLATVNFLIACFNLLPGFPMDGGRILRAVLWHFDKNYQKATRITIIFGLIFASILLIVGLVNILSGYNSMGGFWTLLAGFLLLRLLYKVPPDLFFKPIKTQKNSPKVSEIMTKNFISVLPNTPIQEFVKTYQGNSEKTFLVVQSRQLHGILSIADVEKLTDSQKTNTFVYQVMKPVSSQYFVSADLSIEEVTSCLTNNGLGCVAVIDKDSLVVGYLNLKNLSYNQ